MEELLASPFITEFLKLRNLLEVLYFVSSILIMFFIAFGLWQLKLTKKQIETTKEIFKMQSTRESIEMAIVECRRFSEIIIQDSLALEKFCKENNVTYFKDVIFIKTDNGFKVDPKNVKNTDIEKLRNAEDIINRYLNGLEAYALFFLSGVADEKIAFHTNGKTFIKFAEEGFKLIPISNIENDDFHSVKVLYSMWYKKQEAKKLKIERMKIDKKLSLYEEKNIKPLGT